MSILFGLNGMVNVFLSLHDKQLKKGYGDVNSIEKEIT